MAETTERNDLAADLDRMAYATAALGMRHTASAMRLAAEEIRSLRREVGRLKGVVQDQRAAGGMS